MVQPVQCTLHRILRELGLIALSGVIEIHQGREHAIDDWPELRRAYVVLAC